MKIEKLTVGILQEHTYFIIDEKSQHAFIIDPGAEPIRILNKVKEEGLIVEKILLTHGHFDHIGAVAAIREALGCEVVIHEKGKCYLENADWNLSSMFETQGITMKADQYVQDQDIIALQANREVALKVIYVPGHTSDGVAYYNEKEKVAIVGDILFSGSIGKTDHPGGDMAQLIKLIPQRLFILPEETVVYPGHGGPTTIRKEKQTNPFFNIYD